MQLRLELQRNDVADDVSALIAVIRPILTALLYSIKRDVADEVGGYGRVKMKMLQRLRLPGDGDAGISFEYAVHDALRRGEPTASERVEDALSRHCNVPGADLASILFGAEKETRTQLIDTASDLLTPESRVLTGYRGQPPLLTARLQDLVRAHHSAAARGTLPDSISGLWMADLFVGHSDTDRWVGTTVKINPRGVEAAPGLRIAIVPAPVGGSDVIRREDDLVVCPLPYDGAFMEIFYLGWRIVRQVIAADVKQPKPVALPTPIEQQVARELVDRREFSVLEVVEALEAQAQPELLDTAERELVVSPLDDDDYIDTSTVVAPIPSGGTA